ncbi:isocitrate/isopropylmalate family dehydrogenase [Streptomyces sp. M10(2022)]
MNRYRVTLVPGDGSGPELVAAARVVVDAAADAAGFGFDWNVRQAGQGALVESGELLPSGTLSAIRDDGVALKGPRRLRSEPATGR